MRAGGFGEAEGGAGSLAFNFVTGPRFMTMDLVPDIRVRSSFSSPAGEPAPPLACCCLLTTWQARMVSAEPTARTRRTMSVVRDMGVILFG